MRMRGGAPRAVLFAAELEVDGAKSSYKRKRISHGIEPTKSIGNLQPHPAPRTAAASAEALCMCILAGERRDGDGCDGWALAAADARRLERCETAGRDAPSSKVLSGDAALVNDENSVLDVCDTWHARGRRVRFVEHACVHACVPCARRAAAVHGESARGVARWRVHAVRKLMTICHGRDHTTSSATRRRPSVRASA
jgi:hypothetical protein